MKLLIYKVCTENDNQCNWDFGEKFKQNKYKNSILGGGLIKFYNFINFIC